MPDLLTIGTNRGISMSGIGIGIGISEFKARNIADLVPVLDWYPALTQSITPSIGPSWSYSRASSGTYRDSSGAAQTATTNTPRFDYVYSGGSWVCRGFLYEPQRTNILLNSATLSTQSVSVTAQAYTLSFYGAGTITLSGTSTAGPLVGTDANNRVYLTFTPTAGTLTLTVSGSVTNANLEAGSFPTSWISTTGTSATRSQDVLELTGAGFTSIFNASEGAIVAEYDFSCPSSGITYFPFICGFSDAGTNTKRIFHIADIPPGQYAFSVNDGSGGNSKISLGTFSGDGTATKAAMCYKANDLAISVNGSAVSTDTSQLMPTGIDRMQVGGNSASAIFSGHISRLRYYNIRPTDTKLVALSA